MDGLDLIKREGERTVGHLRWPDGGAMAGKAETSPEFVDTATPCISEQKEGTGTKRR
jgi:hypothetical protein